MVLCGMEREARGGAEDSGSTGLSQRQPCLSRAVRTELEFKWEKRF